MLLALQAIQVPQAPGGFGPSGADVVVDAANVLPAETEARINRIAFDVKQKSGGEIAVVTLPDIGQRDGSQVALEIGRQWGIGANAEIGQRTRNAGVVILLVPKETSSTGRGTCRIETGQGAEGFLLDADAGSICRAMTPLFQRQAYAQALELITLQVAQEFAGEFGFALDTALAPPQQAYPQRYPGRGGGLSPGALLFAFLFFMFAMSAMGGRRGRRGCGGCLPIPIFFPFPMGGGYHRGGFGGGGFGGGFGGGGFGGFGGGGGFSGGGGGSSW